MVIFVTLNIKILGFSDVEDKVNYDILSQTIVIGVKSMKQVIMNNTNFITLSDENKIVKSEEIKILVNDINERQIINDEKVIDNRALHLLCLQLDICQDNLSISKDTDSINNEIESAIIKRGGKIQDKRIFISKKNHYLWVIENFKIIKEFPVSLGSKESPTLSGEFHILEKQNLVKSEFTVDGYNYPHWMTIYITDDYFENGIHGIPISDDGRKRIDWEAAINDYNVTNGCVVSYDENISWLFNWANVGLPISIFE